MYPKDAEGIANSVDPDQTAPLGLILVCTVRPDLSVRKHRIIRVICWMEYAQNSENTSIQYIYRKIQD